MIFIGLGGNLHSPEFGPPEATLKAVLAALPDVGVAVARQSGFWRSSPVPASDQPWYVNAVAEIATPFDALTLLAALHRMEARFGRERRTPNESRVVDLDLLDFHGLIRGPDQGPPELPHPRMAARNFVLRPLLELAPGWRHPVTGVAIEKLIINNSINDISELID